MIVNVINIEHVSPGQPEGNAPICLNGHRPKAFAVAFERMEPVPWQIKVLRRRRNVEARQNTAELFDMPGIQPSRVIILIKALQALMTSCLRVFERLRSYAPIVLVS